MNGSRYVAVDLGAESGRVIVGTLYQGRVDLQEVHRFANTPVRTPDGLHWDVLRLYRDILDGLRAANKEQAPIAGIGVDSWGVDYGLLDAGGRLLGLPYHYRDARTDGVREQAEYRVPAQEQYARTGIAQLPFNTLYQVLAQRLTGDRTLDVASSLLLMPDLLHYWLTGERMTEYSNASTTGALAVDGAWAADLLARLDVPSDVFVAPAHAGTIVGRLHASAQAECGLGTIPVILPATHDTACAVAAVPSRPARPGVSSAYISSGTWSLIGLELDYPIVSDKARVAGFTNERGVAGTFRFLRNIMGLWLVQECRRVWARGGHDWSYQDVTVQAAAIPSPNVVIDVDDPAFLHPADMPAAIRNQLARTGQPPLEDPIVLVRAILEGLALSYRVALEQAERLAGTRVETIHIVGGGSRNSLLCRLTANACGRPVESGPVEATALGNVLTQAMGTGDVRDLAEAHAMACASTQVTVYEPETTTDWDDLLDRLGRLRHVS